MLLSTKYQFPLTFFWLALSAVFTGVSTLGSSLFCVVELWVELAWSLLATEVLWRVDTDVVVACLLFWLLLVALAFELLCSVVVVAAVWVALL